MNTETFMDSAPLKIKEKAIELNRAFNRQKKATLQSRLWQSELDNAAMDFKTKQQEYGDMLTRWNPETNQFDDFEELKMPEQH